MPTVTIELLEDGGNPRNPSDIRETDDGWLIAPFSEDGDPNYKFRLDVDLLNESSDVVETDFTIEWDDEEYSNYRKYVLLSQGDDWQKLPAEIDGTRAKLNVPVPPGRSHFSMHPQFNIADLNQMIEGLDKNVFRIGSAGKSLHDRDIVTIETGAEGVQPLLVICK